MVETSKLILLIINWVIFSIAGVVFIQRGVQLQKRAFRYTHKITKTTLGLRGNLSITAGIVCLLWVIYGVVWYFWL